ncbi:aspartyl/asparaginyl beta-hydroxylase domain-containing protein [Phenylobacterium sp. VNQ135]|uniref:aspartyl/asparaginyl beta-hydroxylase domain-containing protein n=1 Tax=Phenylobacterium sp. VNQ135 TaxID=3400922 RepID=UPI003C11A285
MSSTAADPATLQAAWRDGGLALREGRAAEALALFTRITEGGQPNAAVWIGVAMAHKALGDRPAERKALEAALALEPRNARALLMMADSYAADGAAKSASSYYNAVVRLADMGQVEPALQAEAARARAMHAHYGQVYEDHLRGELAGHGIDRPEARRARKAVDLLLGKTQLYLQQPMYFYYPELPNIEWADRADFPWMDKVEAATDDIRDELLKVLEEETAFRPYVEAVDGRPTFDNLGLLGNPAWSAFYLWKDGDVVAENAARCPKTMQALADVPLCRIPGRTPSVLFSLLRPGAHIPPHHGFMNSRYICHLPLIVPSDCAMRVGSETRPWTVGEACIFDDSIEHEAWNRNPEHLRVVMIFDIWRPELSPAERDLISATLQAVDSYGDAPPTGD